MAEKENRGGKPESVPGDDEYEIDMDKHSPGDLDAAIREAMDAVERESGGFEALGGDDAPAADGETPDGEAPDGEASVEAQLKERLLRTLADFDNYRKRAEKEKKTLRRMGAFDVLKDSLAVIDNLERALEAGGGVEDLKQGLRLILRQQEEFLRRHEVERIAAEGQVFDPTVHEAVARQESAEVREPTVIGELQKGYVLHDRLLRPAMVHVAMPAAPPPSAAAEEAADAEDPEASAGEPRAAGQEVEEVAD